MPNLTDIDILEALQREQRFCELRDQLFERFKGSQQRKESFSVILSRKLKRLKEYIRKRDESHKMVFYVLNERGLEEIQRIRVKREISNSVDSLDSITPEQADKIIEVLKKSLDAALENLVEKKVMEALNEEREYITYAEISKVYEEVRRKVRTPQVGSLYGTRKKAWHLFLQKKHPDLWQLIKDGKTPTWPKDILRDFDQYLREDFF